MNKNNNQSGRLDDLPPHDDAAEAGVLGCVLLDQSRESMKLCEERFDGRAEVFFDVRHRTAYAACLELYRSGVGIDSITLHGWLRDRNLLGDAGGLAYVAALPEQVPSANNLPHYLDIVWEKFLARRLLQDAGLLSEKVALEGGLTEPLIAAKQRMDEEFTKLTHRGTITPQFLKPATEFHDAYMQRFFGGESGAPGAELPIPFPLKIRPGEMTLLSGDDGAGKSTLLNFFAIHLASQFQPGEKALVVSLEMPPAVTLWILAAQLLGTKQLPDSESGHRRAVDALAWLNQRFLFYDFLGIADWRELRDTFRYAAEHLGMKLAILDSAMRIGIPDDDYAMQGAAAAQFAQGAMDGGYHLFAVIHENKADASGKSKIRGSKLWTANVHNILQVKLNHDKGQKVDKLSAEIENERRLASPDFAEIEAKEGEREKMRVQWDTELNLRKQRWPGTRQNGCKRFWYDPLCFQFRAKPEEVAINWLERWVKK